MSEVQVPAVGGVKKRWVLYGGAAVAVIVAVAYYRRRRASAATAPTVDTTTGALNADGTYVNPAPVRSVDNTIDTSGGTAIITNDQWTQAAIAQMPNWDPQYLQIALGNFLADQPLDNNQANAVRAAEALVGRPPLGNHVIILSTVGPAPGVTTNPAPTTPAPGQQDTAPAGADVYDWSDHHVLVAHGTAGDALNILRSLNPQFSDKNINWMAVPGSSTKKGTFKTTMTLRVS